MEALIKIQSIIQMLESMEVGKDNIESLTKFYYKSQNELIITTSSWEKTSIIKNMCRYVANIAMYVESNTTIKVLAWEPREELEK